MGPQYVHKKIFHCHRIMKRISLFTLLILTVIPRDSEAQIINVENARMQSDTTGWMGNVGALV